MKCSRENSFQLYTCNGKPYLYIVRINHPKIFIYLLNIKALSVGLINVIFFIQAKAKELLREEGLERDAAAMKQVASFALAKYTDLRNQLRRVVSIFQMLKIHAYSVPQEGEGRGGDYGPTSRENVGQFLNWRAIHVFSWGHNFIFAVLLHKRANLKSK